MSSVNKVIKSIKRIKMIVGLLNVQTLLILGVAFFLLVILLGIIGGISSSKGKYMEDTGQSMNLSETTLQWLDDVTKEAEKQGVPELIPYIMAIIEVESKGVGTDIMQSGESAGLGKNGFDDPLKSIEQGVTYLKNSKLLAESLGITDMWAIVQSYNFGTNYVNYLAEKSKDHSIEIADTYSREVVAPSLGNTTGATYAYKNATSVPYNGGYLYSNGGNFFYATLVRKYVGIGSAELPLGDDMFDAIMDEGLKYEAYEYSWGSDNPTSGFDCSGLMQWVYAKAGITLPRTAAEQWTATEEIPKEDAEPGDLIFFKGTYGAPDFISHVGIYIDETRMYDSDGAGLGFHYWTDSYWMSHFDSIHRVKH